MNNIYPIILWSSNDNSNKIIIGAATNTNERGSGGDKNAPKTTDENQICLLYFVKSDFPTISNLSKSKTAIGTWKPNALANTRDEINPEKFVKVHWVDKSAAAASLAK